LSASTSANYLISRLRSLQDGDDADQRFHAATADKMLELLGSMKGAAMKLGQLASFVDLDLPPEAQATYHAVLADLRDSAPPADPAAIRRVLTEQYGAPPERVFRSWDDVPLASASIGQVHRAELDDGTAVVAKVQYPGVAEAIESDLANAELFAPMARMISPNLRIKPLMDELRDRLGDEIDYQREAQYQAAFHERYHGHPFIRVPRVFTDYCRPRVIVSEYVDGASFDEMMRTSSEAERQRYGEIIYRFVFGSLHRFRLFNGDPHPGNYLFPRRGSAEAPAHGSGEAESPRDGTVVFLDFGSVKLFSSATRDGLRTQLQAIRRGDVPELVSSLAAAGFLTSEHPVDTDRLMQWFRMFNEPILEDRTWTYTPDFARAVIRTTTDPRAGYLDLLRRLNLPPDYLMLNRIQWGVNSILGRLRATANWYRITNEFLGRGPAEAPPRASPEANFLGRGPAEAPPRASPEANFQVDGPPATELGEQEAEFMAASSFRA
jgi:predicted unusual protein kinase regulating ubiquinone biosynthesis (AarF/ABC1/UbiB family)